MKAGKKINLTALINDESYLRWLRGTSSADETKKWQKWHSKSVYNQKLTQKVIKIVSIPFKNPEISIKEVEIEKERFNERFLRLIIQNDP